MAADLGPGVTAWSPLAGGVLTGKQLDSGGTKDSRQSDPALRQFMASNARKEAWSVRSWPWPVSFANDMVRALSSGGMRDKIDA
jgi:hypothetical protein